MKTKIAQHLTSTRLAVALAAGLLPASPAGWGAVMLTGPYWLVTDSPAPIGPGDVNIPDAWFVVGAGAPGSFAATAGSVVSLGGLALAGAGGNGTGLIDGANTRVMLNFGPNQSRLDIGHFGTGTLTVSNGATVDGRGNREACVNSHCFSAIAGTAGSRGTLNVTGASSAVSLLGSLSVAGTYVDNGFGVPGASSVAAVNLSAGGQLTTDQASLGNTYMGPASLGNERSFAVVTIDGLGSRWRVTGDDTLRRIEAAYNMANRARASVYTTISGGGQLAIESAPGHAYALRVGNGGDAQMTFSGSGSRLAMSGDTDRGVLNIAEGGGTDLLQVQAGASLVSTARWITAGAGGGNGQGSLIVAGVGSTASFSNMAALSLGDNARGILNVSGGSALSVGQLNLGRQTSDNSRGTATIDGADSRVTLGQVTGERLYIGNGAVTVSGGGLRDARVNAVPCEGGVWCAAQVGAYAGANAKLTVTGAGSTARFLGEFQAGIADLGVQALDGYTVGTPGESVIASVQVLKGGLIQADLFHARLGNYSRGSAGLESSLTNVLISGAGSTMQLTGGDGGAVFQTLTWNAKNATVNVNINDGGKLQLQSPGGMGASILLSGLAGNSVFKVSGAGSAVEFSSNVGSLLSLASNGGMAAMSFSDGAQLLGVSTLWVGNVSGQGALSFDGAGTAGQLSGCSSSSVGRRGGQGALNIRNGATLVTDSATTTAAIFTVGQGDATSRGSSTLNISGAGSALRLIVADSIDAVRNPTANICRQGDGVANVTAGGSLLQQGGLPVPAQNFPTTSLTIGAGSLNMANGMVNVSGAGSTVAVTGTNAYITVGSDPLGSGQLNIRDGARVQPSLMGIGDRGGSGMVRVDNATLKLSGEWTGLAPPLGASLSLDAGEGGVGTLTLDHGARLSIENIGTASTALQVGGLMGLTGAAGALTVANGSRIDVSSASGQGQVFIGRSGTGVAIFSSGSALNADYVGVGSVLRQDGGVGTLIVNQSTITATTIEIGAYGYVGGNGTRVGHIINRGVFSPGNSPGTLVIGGSSVNAAGGRLMLEVEADGHGGFNTDHLIFAAGTAVDLGGLQVSFRFVGKTDPNAFQASGKFDVDGFFQQRSSTGVDTDLNHGVFQAVSFDATANAYTVSSFSSLRRVGRYSRRRRCRSRESGRCC